MNVPQRAGRRPQRRWLLVLAVVLPLLAADGAIGQAAPVPAVPGGPEVRLLGPFEALEARSRVTVLLGVFNDGPGAIEDVVVTVRPDPGSGVVIVGFDGDRTTDEVADGDTHLVGLTLATPPEPGPARLNVILEYVDPSGVPRQTVREVGLLIRPRDTDPIVVEYDGRGLTAGSDGSLRFRVRNTATDEVEDLELQLRIDTATVTAPDAAGASGRLGFATDLTPSLALPDGSRFLFDADLAPGASRSVDVPVLTSLAAPDLVQFTVEASYVLDGFERRQAFTFGDRLAGGVSLRLLDLRAERPDDGLELTGILVNTGTGTAWNPLLSIPAEARYAPTRPLLVEDLEPNEPVAFRLPTAREGAGTPTRGPVLVVEWNDDFGNVHRETLEALPEEAPPEEGGFLRTVGRELRSPTGVVGAAIVVAGVLFALKRAGRLPFGR